ncbi:MAG: hypothetical protein EXS50_00570 [Candidatus Taylorbacteria bacterium]|nr:hypothetical protein [Candidatus Taylorbacteria bacterium]
MVTVIIFLIVLATLVLVHEFGHFIVAKKFGIRVDEFGLGLPPRMFGKKYGETLYSLNWIPFGGFVKIFGETPDADSIDGPDSARSFIHKNRMIQAAVLIAGIVCNIIFAWLLVSLSFMIGILSSSSEHTVYSNRIVDSHVAIIAISKDTPADLAGLKVNDTIIGLHTADLKDVLLGEQIKVPSIQNFIATHANKNILITVIREKEVLEKSVLAKEGIVKGRVAIGVAMDEVGTLKLPLHLALLEGAKSTGEMIKGVGLGLSNLIYQIFTGTANLSGVSGPVGIVGLVGDATRLGFSYLLNFTALISINLALINLVPFPALDGGRLLFVLIEAIRRKAITPKIANTLNLIGFALLILLMFVVTYRDVLKLVH